MNKFIVGNEYRWEGSNPFDVIYLCTKTTKCFVEFVAFREGQVGFHHKFRKFECADGEYIKVNRWVRLFAKQN